MRDPLVRVESSSQRRTEQYTHRRIPWSLRPALISCEPAQDLNGIIDLPPLNGSVQVSMDGAP
jgi:hypothetical protein